MEKQVRVEELIGGGRDKQKTEVEMMQGRDREEWRQSVVQNGSEDED